jgi:hypothetical protein
MFSVINYNKSGSRCGLKNSTVAAIVQVQLLQRLLTGFGKGAKTMQIDNEKRWTTSFRHQQGIGNHDSDNHQALSPSVSTGDSSSTSHTSRPAQEQ